MTTAIQVLDVVESALSPDKMHAQVQLIQQVMSKVMRNGEHYGVVPGCGDKPTLLKPGAEKLCFTFRMAPSFQIIQTDLPGGHREFQVVTTLKHIGSGQELGQGVGACSSLETKYRYRGAETEATEKQVPKEYWDLRNADPAAAQELLGGKDFVTRKDNGVWMIHHKIGKKENPDPADQFNTILKMAKKRSLVDAVLTATAASDIFTQDIEEMAPVETEKPKASPPQQPPAASPAPSAKPGPKLSPKDGVDALISRTTNKALRDKLHEKMLEYEGSWQKERKEWTDTEYVAAGQKLRAFLATPEAAKIAVQGEA